MNSGFETSNYTVIIPESHLQRVRLALQQLVSFLGGLQAALHEGLGASRREDVDAVLARHDPMTSGTCAGKKMF